MIADNHQAWPPYRSFRVGLLGAGYIAKWHAEALGKLPSTRLVAVADISQTRAAQVASECRGEVAAYASLQEMLERAELDAVHILTPPDLHAAAAIECLQAQVAVFLEKPMAASVQECQMLSDCVQLTGGRLAVNHNFLFSTVYESLRAAVQEGRLGRLDAIDVCWNKPLPQLSRGPFSIWMLRDPRNLVLELGPHVVTPILDLVGEPDQVSTLATHPIEMPGNRTAMRNWICGMTAGRTAIQVRLTLGMGPSEFKLRVRGTHGWAVADFEDNTFQIQRPTHYSVDFDRFHRLRACGNSLKRQATAGLTRYAGSKFGLVAHGNPYGESIFHSIEHFYHDFNGPVDPRQSVHTGGQAIALCERIADSVSIDRATAVNGAAMPIQAAPMRHDRRPPGVPGESTSVSTTPVLVLGGTGFIGQALVKKLAQAGQPVRLLVRRPHDVGDDLRHPCVEICRGDFANPGDVRAALQGVSGVYHLARGFAKTWQEYVDGDIHPSTQLAKLTLEENAGRLVYTSSIDAYFAGNPRAAIHEQTGLDPHYRRRNLYAQSKAVIEQQLMAMHAHEHLDLVIVRPGIVLGAGGSPFHWGVGMWNSDSACELWGDGKNILPFVLVDDVADGLIRAMTTPAISGQSFNLVSDPCLTAWEYLTSLSNAMGATIEVLPKRIWQFYLNDMLKWSVKTLIRHPARRLPSYRDWKSRTQQSPFDCTQAKQVLGWNPRSDRETMIREGIQAAVEAAMR